MYIPLTTPLTKPTSRSGRAQPPWACPACHHASTPRTPPTCAPPVGPEHPKVECAVQPTRTPRRPMCHRRSVREAECQLSTSRTTVN